MWHDEKELETMRNYACVDRSTFYAELEDAKLFESEVVENLWMQVKYDIEYYHKIMFALSNAEYALADAIIYCKTTSERDKLKLIRDEFESYVDVLRNSVLRRHLLI